MNTSAQIMVIAAVVKRDGKFLVCRRPAHKRHGGLWEFPGGKVETDESFLDAARRELEEELALSVSSIGEVHLAIKDDASGFTINFVDVIADGEPQLIEHSELQWLGLPELRQLALAPSDRHFAEYLAKAAER